MPLKGDSKSQKGDSKSQKGDSKSQFWDIFKYVPVGVLLSGS